MGWRWWEGEVEAAVGGEFARRDRRGFEWESFVGWWKEWRDEPAASRRVKYEGFEEGELRYGEGWTLYNEKFS